MIPVAAHPGGQPATAAAGALYGLARSGGATGPHAR